MLYQLKIVFVDNQELILDTTQKHGFSDDLELFEVTTSEEIFVVPLKQIKYISCDAKIFQKQSVDSVTIWTKLQNRTPTFFIQSVSLKFP